MRRRVALILAAAAVLVGLVPAAGASAGVAYRIRIQAQGLAPLVGAFYEVWAVYGERKLSAGGFNVDAEGRPVDGLGHAARFYSPRNPARADAIVVTVEPIPDPDPAPSGIAILAGTPRKNTARLRFPAKLGSLAGSFILATPTDTATNDETAGVWFLDPGAGPGPSLDLPELPSGWVWEGWGVTQGTPLSTGRFTSATGADSAAPFSGPNAGPPFPGEDFLANLPGGIAPPVNLANGSSIIVLTIEPDLGGTDPTGAGPFSIKPLLTTVSAGATDHTSIALVRDLSTVPRGTATF